MSIGGGKPMHIAHENHQKFRLMVKFVYLTTSVLGIREISSCLSGDMEKGKKTSGKLVYKYILLIVDSHGKCILLTG